MAKITRQQKLTDYDGFVEKFKPKKTTDDCYTPQPYYDALLAWLREHVPAVRDATEIVRPFWPGGDYESAVYPEGCVVVDNPPFSILSKIVNFYTFNGVAFWLFAPHLTLFNYCAKPNVTAVVTDSVCVYENGAVVNTSFLTNVWPTDSAAVILGDLAAELNKVAKPEKAQQKKLAYPQNVTSAALLGKAVPGTRGLGLEIPRSKCGVIRRLDCGQSIFGSGLILADSVAAEIRAAEIRAAEIRAAEIRAAEIRAAETETLPLSTREQEIIKILNKQNETR